MNISKMLYWVVLIFLALPLQGCALSNSAPALDGQVADAETHQPLEGVNVVAAWNIHLHGFNGGEAIIKLMEAVTDKDGRYHFPAWGPEPLPANMDLSAFLPSGASGSFQYPRIEFFKSGYMPAAVSNEITGPSPKLWATESEWDGKTIELKKFKGDMDLYDTIASRSLTGTHGPCEMISKVPRATAALIKEGERLNQLGLPAIRNSFPTIRSIEQSNDKNCGPALELLRKYLK